jgi:hypothetical protein
LRDLGLLGMFWLPYSALCWFTPFPLAVLALVMLPVLSWASGDPARFLAALGLYIVPGLSVELLRVFAGVLSSGKQDLRFLLYALPYLFYQRLRMDFFAVEALDREWRHRPMRWHD